MNQAHTLKCPACGAYLVYEPEKDKLVCPFCEAEFTQEQADAQQATAQAAEPSGHTHTYHCASCGAELVTDETTAATFCYYCHNPITLMDRVTDEFQPDGMIPFAIDREGAVKRFKQFLSKKWFVRREFFAEGSLEKLTGVFYPYWMGDLSGDGEYQGEGTRVSIASTPKYDIITTRYYDVHRAGEVHYRQMMRKALEKCDRKLSDGVHPYRFSALRPFSTALLSGYMAHKRDVPQATAQADMEQEAQEHTKQVMTQGLHYDTLHGSATFQTRTANLRYMLLPTWVLTYRNKQEEAAYYYMMNGQTGNVCGKLPIDWGKLLGAAVAVGAAVCGLLCLGGAFLW